MKEVNDIKGSVSLCINTSEWRHMENKFRAHHIICTSLYEGKGYNNAFCENMTSVVNRLRDNPDEELTLVAKPDLICINCPNQTKSGKCSHNHNRVVNKDRRVMKFFGLKENQIYTYREMCRHAREAMTTEFFMENCGKCNWRKRGLCKYEDLIAQLDHCIEK